MKKTFLLFNFTFCILHFAFSQNPLVKQWDKRYGGTSTDILSSFQETNDGGFILGGYSSSAVSGDKSQPSWGTSDYWIVKLNSLGNLEWEKNFGGNTDEYFYSIQQTSDGGYILGGYSLSGISGDKTQANWGVYDYWIVKTDSLGNKQWDKDLGGIDGDVLLSLQQTSDGGYILGGWSYSGISGDKSQNTWGVADYWIVKTDSLGNKIWDKNFGGIYQDFLYSVQQTSDGGYILGGSSNSGNTGDKTQAGWGDHDYWIVKTDSLGNKIWDKDFGGANYDELISLQQTSDKGYILGGYSNSNISGDKTQNSYGGNDFWIVKIDSLGNKQWDKDFGGAGEEDEFGNAVQTSDGGYLFAGTSYSFISGTKTENNLGPEQSWVLKTDSSGNVLWDKTIFTTGHEEVGLAIQTKDGCYAFANYDNGAIGGYRTQPNWDTTCIGVGCTYDYWIVKFCDSTAVPVAGFTSSNHICPGTCTDFQNLSVYATSYQWFFPGATPDTSTSYNPTNICYANPGNYNVQLIAINATGSDTLILSNYITVYPFPSPQSISQSGDTLFALAGSDSYQWYFNGSMLNGATNYYYIATTSGNYNVVATDSNGCEVEAVINNVIAAVGSGSMQSIQVYPNPVTDKFTIQNLQACPSCVAGRVTSGTTVEISIYNVLGEKILSGLPRSIGTESVIDVSRITSGIYWLEIISDNKIFRTKFVKQ